MHSRLPMVSLVVVTASSAFAQPRQPAAKVPMRPVPCAMDGATLHAAGLDPVVCWDKGCMKPDFQGNATWHIKPPAAKDWTSPVAEVKDDQVCLGSTCKKLGKKLAAAIAEQKKNQDPSGAPQTFSATTDLKAVVLSNHEIWSVVTDQKLKLTAPALYKKTGEKPSTMGAVPAGDLLVVWWSACAGPCTKFQITDSSGRPKGGEGEGGGGVFQLDAKRFVVYGEYGGISVFEFGTGKPRGAIPALSQEPQTTTVLRLDDESAVAMFGKGDGVEVAKVDLWNDKSLSPRVGQSQYLPKCNAP